MPTSKGDKEAKRKASSLARKAGDLKRRETIKERYGSDFFKRIGRMGGRRRGRGYFGYLKDTNPELLKKISKRGSEKGHRVQGELREFKRAIAKSLAENQDRS
nr:MAG TPA: hypothetical protein [Caudoviricetes sp.]